MHWRSVTPLAGNPGEGGQAWSFIPPPSPPPPIICVCKLVLVPIVVVRMVDITLILTPGLYFRRKVLGMVLEVLLSWLASQEWGARHGV